MYVTQSYGNIAFCNWMYFIAENLQLIFFPYLEPCLTIELRSVCGYIPPPPQKDWLKCDATGAYHNRLFSSACDLTPSHYDGYVKYAYYVMLRLFM
jgi:hypothetical protein